MDENTTPNPVGGDDTQATPVQQPAPDAPTEATPAEGAEETTQA